MAVPDFQSLMLPVLSELGHGIARTTKQLVETISDTLGLAPEDRRDKLPSGGLRLNNRVGWALTYLKKAGLAAAGTGGTSTITQEGVRLLAQRPKQVDIQLLSRYPTFVEFRARRTDSGMADTTAPDDVSVQGGAIGTPEEQLDAADRRIREALEADVLQRVLNASPAFFEALVVDVLVKLGYGASELSRVTGKSGDEGIDGIIKQDRLGMDAVYVQAKRWSGPVGRKEVQAFVGALKGQRATKGVFITSSSFHQTARDYVERIDTRVVLMEGRELARYMVELEVGVLPARTYQIKRVDEGYFLEE